MKNQVTPLLTNSEQTTLAAEGLCVFGAPEQIILDGENITNEAVEKFGGIQTWLRQFVRAFSNFHILAFTITRISGVTKLYARSIY